MRRLPWLIGGTPSLSFVGSALSICDSIALLSRHSAQASTRFPRILCGKTEVAKKGKKDMPNQRGRRLFSNDPAIWTSRNLLRLALVQASHSEQPPPHRQRQPFVL